MGTKQLKSRTHGPDPRRRRIPGAVLVMDSTPAGGKQPLDPHADDAVPIMTEERLDVTIRHHDPAVVVADQDPVGRQFHDHPREPHTQTLR